MGALSLRPPANDPVPIELLGAANTCAHAAGDLLQLASRIAGGLLHGADLATVVSACRLVEQEAMTLSVVMGHLAEALALIESRRAR